MLCSLLLHPLIAHWQFSDRNSSWMLWTFLPSLCGELSGECLPWGLPITVGVEAFVDICCTLEWFSFRTSAFVMIESVEVGKQVWERLKVSMLAFATVKQVDVDKQLSIAGDKMLASWVPGKFTDPMGAKKNDWKVEKCSCHQQDMYLYKLVIDIHLQYRSDARYNAHAF